MTKVVIDIRTIQERDHAGVLAVAAALPAWFDEDARRRAIPADLRHQHGFLAVADGETVGFITLFFAEGRLNIGWLGVTPDHEREGIGAKLLGAAEEFGRSHAMDEIATYTLGAGVVYAPYEVTRRFYFSQGFGVYQTSKTDNPGCPEEIRIKKRIAPSRTAPLPRADAGQILIRRARIEDAAALGQIHTASWKEAYRELVPADYLARLDAVKRAEGFRGTIQDDRDTETWCAEQAGIVTGFVTLGPSRDTDSDTAKTGEIYAIYLAPDRFRQGLGTMLCRQAEARLKAQGFSTAVLWVLAGNGGSRGFYEAMGFTHDGSTKELTYGGSKLPAIRYRKGL